MDIKYKELSLFYKNLWWLLDSDLNLAMKKYSDSEKRKKEKEFINVIDKIINFIESFPKEDSNREKWKIRGNIFVEKIISMEGIFKLGILDKEMKDSFIKSTKEFIKAAKNFDSKISYEDIGQAMRNVWIVNMLQQAFNSKIQFSNAIFGYSMLYPYTDNYLDNINISKLEKRNFNNRFAKKLDGEEVDFINEHEEKVYRLLKYIESEFDRNLYPEVYNSLKLIHEGQIHSLNQQDYKSIPYEKDILGISIEKGGASVIADGYLVTGKMDNKEELFSYGYGFLLQLCDDLQDIRVDKENNHITLMSQLAGNYKLDSLANKLINLTENIVNNAECFKCKNSKELKDLIKSNCIYMILFAVVDNKEYFSERYIDNVTEYLPFSLEYCNNIRFKIENKFKMLKSNYNGVELEEILLYFIS